jgi:stage II sporulation protein E
MLKAKIDIIESIYLSNNILQLKNDLESYTTLDLCAIDTNKSIVSFFKLGAFTTFIIRDHIVTEVNNYSLPLGIIEQINVIPSSYKIQPKDIIVMCSDGMIDDSNLNVISILEDLNFDDAETICSLLFSKLIRIRENGDDATLAIITIK